MKIKIIFAMTYLINFFFINTATSLEADVDGIDSIVGTRVHYVRDVVNFCNLKNFTSSNLENIITRELNDADKFSLAIKNNPLYVETIGDQIIQVASCFDIDPLVFSALIGHESFFYNRSVSATGAIGLGQLTGISRKEIAQQLFAPHVPKEERGTEDALEYWNQALSCVEVNANFGAPLKHWWKYTTTSERESALKRDTVLNLAYSAMIFKISYSKSISYINKYDKSETLNNVLKFVLGYYNGASETEKLNHYRQTRKLMNDILEDMSETTNKCYLNSNVKRK